MHTSTLSTALAALLLLGCDDRPAPPPPPSTPPPPSQPAPQARWVTTATGIDSLRVGWPLARFNAAIAEQLRPTYQISQGCDILRPKSFPVGVSVMVLLDTVVRFDVDSTGVLTVEGAGVGDSEARVLDMYRGSIEVQPHKYTGPEGHYLVVTPVGDTLHRIIFETDGKRVLNYRVGSRPGVELIEGCA